MTDDTVPEVRWNVIDAQATMIEFHGDHFVMIHTEATDPDDMRLDNTFAVRGSYEQLVSAVAGLFYAATPELAMALANGVTEATLRRIANGG